MPYATPAQLSTRVGADRYLDLVDRDGDDVVDVGTVEGALDAASAKADSYLSRYSLAVRAADLSVRSAVLSIAIYELAGDQATTEERLRYEDAIQWLMHVQKGAASIGSAEATTPTSTFVVDSEPAVMSREATRGIL